MTFEERYWYDYMKKRLMQYKDTQSVLEELIKGWKPIGNYDMHLYTKCFNLLRSIKNESKANE